MYSFSLPKEHAKKISSKRKPNATQKDIKRQKRKRKNLERGRVWNWEKDLSA